MPSWRSRRSISLASVLLWAAILARFDQQLAQELDSVGDRGAVLQQRVTSSADSGPGTLREAIFAVNGNSVPARIEILADRVVLESPLPPIVSSTGVSIEGKQGGIEIDARGVGQVPALDLAGAGIVVRRVTVRGAIAQAVMVRAPRIRLEHVGLVDGVDGVLVAEGADNLTIEDCLFQSNGVGLRVVTRVKALNIRRNRFLNHVEVGLLAVTPARPGGASRDPDITLWQNQFRGDRISAAFVNTPARIEQNTFATAQEVGLYVVGPSIVRRNRMQQGLGFGIYAEAADGTIIEDNELDHNAAGGLQVRGAGSSEVRRNRVYSNGYGIVVVFGGPHAVVDNLVFNQQVDGLFVLGGNPVLRRNRVVENGQAGVRIFDYVTRAGAVLTASPALSENVVQQNLMNEPQHGRYHEPEPKPQGEGR